LRRRRKEWKEKKRGYETRRGKDNVARQLDWYCGAHSEETEEW
jgi:hypothetical protein